MGYPRKRKYLIGPEDGTLHFMSGFGGVRLMLGGDETGGAVAIVEHPVEPRGSTLRHTHAREDEYTYVIEGEIGFEIGGEEFTAGPGHLVLKPRGVPHAFWNATDKPAKVLEIISPAGFERFFEDVAALPRAGGMPEPDTMRPLWERYGNAVDLQSGPELARKHGLRMPGNAEAKARRRD